jgi:hypothetical protein
LGKNNVIFIDGYNKYWMSEFIQEFRKKKLWLQLRTSGKEKSKIPSNNIILYSYNYKKIEGINTLRQRNKK